LRAAAEHLDAVWAQQAAHEAETVRLRDELPRAQQRDREALAHALSARDPEPTPEAPVIEEELKRSMARSQALLSAIDKAQQDVAAAVLRHRDRWASELRHRHLVDATARYTSAVAELERAREALVDEIRVGAWLEAYPASPGAAMTAYTPHIDPTVRSPGQPFAEIAGALRRDAQTLPAAGPVRVTERDLARLERKQIVVEHVGADGIAHPRVLKGDTPEGWAARDFVDRVLRK
jgi:hypothetical protein